MQWLLKAFADLRTDARGILRRDNTDATISIAEDDQINNRTKHIDVYYHTVREGYRKREFQLLYIPSSQKLADICMRRYGSLPTRILLVPYAVR